VQSVVPGWALLAVRAVGLGDPAWVAPVPALGAIYTPLGSRGRICHVVLVLAFGALDTVVIFGFRLSGRLIVEASVAVVGVAGSTVVARGVRCGSGLNQED
jgi:hypothetical protein